DQRKHRDDQPHQYLIKIKFDREGAKENAKKTIVAWAPRPWVTFAKFYSFLKHVMAQTSILLFFFAFSFAIFAPSRSHLTQTTTKYVATGVLYAFMAGTSPASRAITTTPSR